MKVCCYSVHAVRRSLLLASAKALPAITGIIPWSAAAQPLVPVRPYHCSQVVLAKAKKAGKGGKDSDDEEDATALPDMNALDRKMEDKIARLGVEFSNIRAGRASVDMFKDLKVDAFGTMTPLADVGQAVLSTPTKMTVTAFDTALAVPGATRVSIFVLLLEALMIALLSFQLLMLFEAAD